MDDDNRSPFMILKDRIEELSQRVEALEALHEGIDHDFTSVQVEDFDDLEAEKARIRRDVLGDEGAST